MKADDFDILHVTGAHKTGGKWRRLIGRRPFVVTIHDLIPELLGIKRQIPKDRLEMLNAANQIIAVSENTKRDIINLFGVSESKISVVYHGRSEFVDQSDTAPFPNMRYILYVGRRGGYKNFSFFVEALSPLLKEDRGLNIVCTGGCFSNDELMFFEKMGVASQIHQKFIPDTSMKQLFAKADCFVYPSLYEGFGIPILDAFAAGCPVILSNCSCFPEVANNAALFLMQVTTKCYMKQSKIF